MDVRVGHDPGAWRRMLVVRLAGVGDGVLLTPFLRALRAACPDARIDLCVWPAVWPLIRLCPHVDTVFTAPDWPTGRLQRLRAYLRYRRAPRPPSTTGQPYDVVFGLDPFVTTIYPLRYLLNTIHTERVIGFDRNAVDVAGNRWITPYTPPDLERGITESVPRPVGRPMVEYGQALLRHLGLPDGGDESVNPLEAWATPEDHAWATDRLPESEHGYVAIGPGASHPNRQWDPSRLAAVALALYRERGLHPVVMGLPAEKQSFIRALADAERTGTGQAFPPPPPDDAPTSLTSVFALLRRCRLYVGNDTGTMHLAAAAGLPTVGVFAYPPPEAAPMLTGPATYRPWGVPHRVCTQDGICPDCAHRRLPTAHCINRIPFESVRDAAFSLLDEVKE